MRAGIKPSIAKAAERESYYLATQWQLIWRRYRKHRLSRLGSVVLFVLYFFAIFAEFFALKGPEHYDIDFIYCPPTRMHLVDRDNGFSIRPYVYGVKQSIDMVKLARFYVEDKQQKHRIRFFVKGHEYRLLGIFRSDVHLLGVDGGVLYPFGSDSLGRDLYSRTIRGARISLSVGLVGVGLSFVLGCTLGAISGLYGGSVDVVVQRIIEFLMSLPHIPLWMGLAAALPRDWPSIRVYFGITVILSLLGWTGLARVVRGKILSLREQDYVMAAHVSGARAHQVILKHMLPGVTSFLIVNITLAIPAMILGETALSFLGIGIQPPDVSWGVLLKDAQNVQTISAYPWMLIPAIFVVATVLSFNFIGDGLRDAADPYK